MSVETIRNIGSRIGSIEGLEGRGGTVGGANRPGGPDFARTLGEAIQSVDQVQLAADEQVKVVANGGGNLHEMALALEKADVAMRLAVKVRNKAVEAYNEIMRMGI